MVWPRGVCSDREFLGGVQDSGEVRIYGISLSRMLKRLLWVSTHMHCAGSVGRFLLSLAQLEVSNLEGRGTVFFFDCIILR
jgi:hypothetical protein